MIRLLLGVLVLAIVTLFWKKRYTDTHPLHLVKDSDGNEALVVDVPFNGSSSMFLVDTAYAGPPVVSTSFLSIQKKFSRGWR